MVETNPFAFAFVCLTVVCVQSVTFFVSLVCGEDFWSSSLFNCACFLLLLLLLWSWYRCWWCCCWWWWWCWSLLVALPSCLFHFISSFCVSSSATKQQPATSNKRMNRNSCVLFEDNSLSILYCSLILLAWLKEVLCVCMWVSAWTTVSPSCTYGIEIAIFWPVLVLQY